MTKTQKKELKARLFKILHGVCYVLSAIFVLVLIVASVKGCSPKKQRTNTSQVLAPQQLINNSQSQIVYKCNYEVDSTIVLSYDVQKELPIFDESQSGVYTILGDFQNDSLTTYKSFNVSYNRYGNIMGCLIDEVYLLEADDSKTLICKQGVDWSTWEYSTYYVSYLFSNGGVIEDALFDLFFSQVELNSFIFNKEFNYNAPMNCSVDSPYYTRPSGMNNNDSALAYKTYNVGLFLSNGELYDTIRWYWMATNGAVYFDFGNGEIKKGPNGVEQGCYTELMYYNSQTGAQRFVNLRDQIAFMPSSSSYAYYYTNSTTWINDEYRYIHFLDEVNDSERVSLVSFNNNNQYSGGGFSGGDNVFTLIGTAFSGILPILGIMILPNITLGMLLFVPLVAILVFAIIRIIKK